MLMETLNLMAFKSSASLLLFWFVPLPSFVLNCVRWVRFKKTSCLKGRNASAELNFPQQDKQQHNQNPSWGAFNGGLIQFNFQDKVWMTTLKILWFLLNLNLKTIHLSSIWTSTNSGRLNFFTLKSVKNLSWLEMGHSGGEDRGGGCGEGVSCPK